MTCYLILLAFLLWHNPPLEDRWYPVPDKATCTAFWNAAGSDVNRAQLVVSKPVLTGWHYDMAVVVPEESDRVKRVWWAALNIADAANPASVRRNYAGILIDLVGYEDYAAGRLPLPLSFR